MFLHAVPQCPLYPCSKQYTVGWSLPRPLPWSWVLTAPRPQLRPWSGGLIGAAAGLALRAATEVVRVDCRA